ncbi:serine/threonine-protein kinase [Curtobacterium flaccumfaciens]|uniref:serine/threonine-protein kinase n=1 Tax=Curtobacterium flaccumfaciens TaxID=2035 RepID=UPI0015980005|nr:serine/threonine-protein kinase [Curtobacterium flaccumfaciens]QKS87390.1 serine/threonine protein kinase [Curtobacterium flaccumfaciens pv. flaccumfaciens]
MALTVYPRGTTINDRYELRGKLGSDGQVYEAYDRHLATTVALKLLSPVDHAPQSWDEAKRLEQLRSHFIVPVLNADVVMESDIRFITTPLLPDGDLERDARPVGLSVATVSRYARHIAAGVDTIHTAGMIHRDIKPANALRNGDNVIVSDVATCVILDEEGTADPDGSYCTVAPEVLEYGGRCSVSSDVYSLAATTFYLLSGEYPVDHRIPKVEQRDRLLARSIRDLGVIAPHVPRAVVTVVRRGLSIEPAARHRSVEEFGNALATAAHGRRDWKRVQHPDHVYCAEGTSHDRPRAVGVCARVDSRSEIVVRAFHLDSNKALHGVPEQPATTRALHQALRRMIAHIG